MVTSDFRPEVEIRTFRACAMHPAIGTVRSLWTWLWGRYHVPQNAFLVVILFSEMIDDTSMPTVTYCALTSRVSELAYLLLLSSRCSRNFLKTFIFFLPSYAYAVFKVENVKLLAKSMLKYMKWFMCEYSCLSPNSKNYARRRQKN